ncbi:MAG TPA: alpha/beta hydrolase [Solirubrobacteraceae bacterium]|nr:alpha/beta hydrolase [Solirubrobacteraceae bacterium]
MSQTGLTPRTDAWRRRGALQKIAGHRIFVRDWDGTGPPLLFLHGYPSSSYDWGRVVDRLPGRRVTAFDFLGFGLSDKPREVTYSLMRQADIVETVARRFAGEPVVLVAHDMGTSVATELLARALENRLGFPLATVLLFNGSMVIERASLTISQKALRSRLGPLVARLSNQRAFRAQFARIFSATHPLSAEEAADQWSLLAHGDGHRIIDRLTYYLHERVTYAARWHGALREWPGQLRLAWAGQDPVCTEAVLQAVLALRPSAPVTRWPELGHYPQIEDPDQVAEVIAGVAPAF